MTRSSIGISVGLAAALAIFPSGAGRADATPPAIAAAVADPARPAADTARDADRKPAELLAFAGIKPGDKIAELMPGSGYFTRIFSKIVGPMGHVYAMVPEELLKRGPRAGQGAAAVAADPAFSGNVSVVDEPYADFKAPEPVDVVWTSLNYHDFHDSFFGPLDMAAFDKAVYAALKPGGIFMVVDHAAAPGSGTRDTETLHRIDPEAVKKEVLGAGFVLEGESDLLRHPADDHTAKVFDSAVRGKTDQFILKFKKPGA
jgi:predicted methyltransferase